MDLSKITKSMDLDTYIIFLVDSFKDCSIKIKRLKDSRWMMRNSILETIKRIRGMAKA